jgi:hypothetical protein
MVPNRSPPTEVVQSTDSAGVSPTSRSWEMAENPHICNSMSGLTTAVPPEEAIMAYSSVASVLQWT